jgi:hypothetical protein
MQAYFEVEAILPADHKLRLDLPDNIPAGRVRVAVIYETRQSPGEEPPAALETPAQGNLDFLLARLPLNDAGRSHDDILKQVAAERESWGNEE